MLGKKGTGLTWSVLNFKSKFLNSKCKVVEMCWEQTLGKRVVTGRWVVVAIQVRDDDGRELVRSGPVRCILEAEITEFLERLEGKEEKEESP